MATVWRNPHCDIREESRTVTEQATALALSLVVLGFLSVRSFTVQAYTGAGRTEFIDIEDIPETEQLKRPPAPTRPQMPVATESEDVPADVTIADTDLDLEAVMPPDPAPPGAVQRTEPEQQYWMFWEEQPEVIKRVRPKYPEIARQAEVEGSVIVKLWISARGDVDRAEVVMADPPGIFEQAALEAVRQWKFKPAKQRDMAIPVMMAQRVDFVLKDRIPPGYFIRSG